MHMLLCNVCIATASPCTEQWHPQAGAGDAASVSSCICCWQSQKPKPGSAKACSSRLSRCQKHNLLSSLQAQEVVALEALAAMQ